MTPTKLNLRTVPHGETELPDLPQVARTRSGVLFNPRAERWSYRDSSFNVSLNFAKLPGATESFIAGLRLTLVWYAENLSSSHLLNMYDRTEHFLRVIAAQRHEPLNEITSRDLINYRSTLTKRTMWYLGSLSGLLQKWHAMGYHGVTDDAVAFLQQVRIPGNFKGEAVLTMDPEHGPFTDIEVQSIHSALDKAS